MSVMEHARALRDSGARISVGNDLGEPDEEGAIAARYDAAVARFVEARRALDSAKVQQKLCKEELDAALKGLLRLRADDADPDARYTQMTLDAQGHGEDGDT
jgi:hypothetical protein